MGQQRNNARGFSGSLMAVAFACLSPLLAIADSTTEPTTPLFSYSQSESANQPLVLLPLQKEPDTREKNQQSLNKILLLTVGRVSDSKGCTAKLRLLCHNARSLVSHFHSNFQYNWHFVATKQTLINEIQRKWTVTECKEIRSNRNFNL